MDPGFFEVYHRCGGLTIFDEFLHGRQDLGRSFARMPVGQIGCPTVMHVKVFPVKCLQGVMRAEQMKRKIRQVEFVGEALSAEKGFIANLWAVDAHFSDDFGERWAAEEINLLCLALPGVFYACGNGVEYQAHVGVVGIARRFSDDFLEWPYDCQPGKFDDGFFRVRPVVMGDVGMLVDGQVMQFVDDQAKCANPLVVSPVSD